MTFDLPKGPSIAVLPFDNMTGDQGLNYLCDGVSENIISSLSYIPELLVIARNSSFSYKGKAINIQQIGQDLTRMLIVVQRVDRWNAAHFRKARNGIVAIRTNDDAVEHPSQYTGRILDRFSAT